MTFQYSSAQSSVARVVLRIHISTLGNKQFCHLFVTLTR